MKIALIDDDLVFAAGFSRRMSKRDIAVTHFLSARAFISSPRRKQFSIIMVDLNMEDSRGVYWKFAGLEALKLIKEQTTQQTPVCIMTGFASCFAEQASLDNGADGYISKDASVDSVVATLSALSRTAAPEFTREDAPRLLQTAT